MYDNEQLCKAIEIALESLDITPTMFREAEKHYRAMANFLNNDGADYDICTFGSIATGTVTRPYTPDEKSYFDFDVLCKRTDLVKSKCNPKDVRGAIEGALLSSERYREMTEPYDECLTVEYVQNGKEGGFRLDLNPCVDNEGDESEIADCKTFPLYSTNTVSIARQNPDSWLGSNPRGLINWFRDKNERFATASRSAQRTAIFNSARDIYASIEEVPWELERTTLQRAIQIAKHSRDIYYYTLGSTAKKPSSCMLMVLMVEATENLPDNATILDIIHSFSNMVSAIQFDTSQGKPTIIGSLNDWSLNNPVYGGSLISNDWTNQDTEFFFKWARVLKEDLMNLATGGTKTQASAQALFGKRAAAALLGGLPVYAENASPNVISTGHKPWRGIE